MSLALDYAREAGELGEAPVGAVITGGSDIIATGFNLRENRRNALLHAEINAISRACTALGGWRLLGCTIYVTLEPCPMCAGAIINSRLDRVVFGAYDKKAGCFGSICDMSKMGFNHTPKVTGGVLKEECGELLTSFFRSRREN